MTFWCGNDLYFATKSQLERKFSTQNCLATHDILIETCRSQIDQINLRLEFIFKELRATQEPGKVAALNHDVEELQHNRTLLETQRAKADIDKTSCYYPDDPNRPSPGRR